MKPPFEHAHPLTRSFYSKVFFNILLNINAVRMGHYPTLLCDTDDPGAGLKWRLAIPDVMKAMRGRAASGDD